MNAARLDVTTERIIAMLHSSCQQGSDCRACESYVTELRKRIHQLVAEAKQSSGGSGTEALRNRDADILDALSEILAFCRKSGNVVGLVKWLRETPDGGRCSICSDPIPPDATWHTCETCLDLMAEEA